MTIHRLFEAQVDRTPDRIPLIHLAGSDRNPAPTYRELNRWANRLARYLQRLGTGPETLVGVCMDPSWQRVVALLAILKAGGAYLPLDPAYPKDRLAFMLADSRAPILLTQAHLRQNLPAHKAHELVFDLDDPALRQAAGENLDTAVTPDHPAYVIYTSGSTGQPKGVIGLHRGAINRFRWMWQTYPFQPEELCCHKTALSFVDSIWEIFGPLLQGIPALVIPTEAARNPELLVQALAAHQVTRLVLVPSLLRVILELPAETLQALAITHWITSGEALPVELAQQFHTRLPGRSLLNLYGSSEVSADATGYEVRPGQADVSIPVGRPISHTQVYVLDAHAQPLPPGEAGELYVGGDNLARGYLHRPELTAEKFVPNPFSQQPGARLYKTGDLARYLPDGNLEFLGRIDQQVKIRGFRIELGEIEAALAHHPGIRETVVIAGSSPHDPHQKRLVAYYVSGTQAEPSPHDLRDFLAEKLPDYMIPALFVILPALPLTPNGKIDRLALPIPAEGAQLSGVFIAPRTSLEQQLAGLWAEILGLEKVGVTDFFLDLGGHSLLATQLISRVRQAFQVELPVRQLFEEGTVAAMAGQVELAAHQAETNPAPIPSVPRAKPLPLSFAQQRLWFLDQLDPGNLAYNMAEVVHLQGPLKVTVLEQALGEILPRHEALRTVFPSAGGQPVQMITGATGSYPLTVIPCSQPEVERLVSDEARRPFDLAQGPLFRATLLRLAEQEHVLLLVMHHIVSDGWSLRLLFDELTALYNAFTAGQPSPLPDLPVQYADFSEWQRQWLQGSLLEKQLAYWRRQLGQDLPALSLPTDHPRPAIQSFNGLTYTFPLSRSLARRLKQLSQQEGVTLFMALLAAFKALLYRYTGQIDLPVGSPIANRNRHETEALIGFFVNTLVLRTNLSGNPTSRELLRRVREVALSAFSHQDLPFEQLVDELQPDRDLSQQPLFQVMFALQDLPVERLDLSNLHATSLVVERQTAQFDLSLDIIETGQDLAGALEYNTDLFEPETIMRLAGHFQTLLEGMVADPETRIADLPLLTPPERRQLLVEWNETRVDYSRSQAAIHHLFEAQAKQSPERLAVIAPSPASSHSNSQPAEPTRLAYGELNRRANRLAHYLQSLGVGPEVPVAICLERSAEIMVAVLGILKAGGAYVPLDPYLPPDRLAFMLADTGAPILLTQASLSRNLPELKLHTIYLDSDWPLIAGYSPENPESLITADHLAYIIFTSGSTGRSKGVMINHRSLVNAYLAWEESYRLRTEVSSHLQMANFAFDVFSGDWVRALCSGGKLVLAPRDYLLSPPQLYQLMRQEAVDIAEFVPAIFRTLAQYLAETNQRLDFMRLLIVGSDNWYLGEYKKTLTLCGPQTRLINSYGLTEATIDSSYFALECGMNSALQEAVEYGQDSSLQDSGMNSALQKAVGDRPVPVGRPFQNTQLYILDTHLHPVPAGVPGELCVGGVGLARGYLNRPDLTAEKFVPHPFSDQPGARLYRTGDLARYLPGGQIELLGRLDHQVKLRGVRIELGEIEALLGEHPAVHQAVALVRKNDQGAGDKQLVAYVVPRPISQSATLAALMQQLAADRINQWQMVYDQETLDGPNTGQEPTFNITGWNSSYTGQPISAGEMQEWVDQTVERILALKPERVLEIGCGTGLLLFRIAPACQHYHGADFSQTALNYVHQQLQRQPIPGVTLSRRLADDVEGLVSQSFDTIIINSVIQYFPTIDYLVQVLTQAMSLLKPGGNLFVGDVRHLGLLELFHSSVQRYQAPETLPLDQLQQRISRSLSQEEELVIDPAFFSALARRLSGINHVEILLKRGHSHNELTRFRYDVILHQAGPGQEKTGIHRLDWREAGLTLESLRQWLRQEEPELARVVNIPNARLSAETQALAWLDQHGGDFNTVEDLRQALARLAQEGIDPEDLWALEAELPYQIRLSWANSNAEGRYEALFRRQCHADAMGLAPLAFPDKLEAPQPWQRYANNPLQPLLGQKLVPQLRDFLKEKLPAPVIPGFFVMLESFPLTPNGKIDRQALPAPDLGRSDLARDYVAPRTPVEELMASLWEELLGLGQVGIRDNFFELGGHSLLATQLVSRLRQTFQLEFPLRHIFESPTIEGLAGSLTHYEAKPGQVAAIARLRQQIKGMSPDQVQAMLREKKKAKSGQ